MEEEIIMAKDFFIKEDRNFFIEEDAPKDFFIKEGKLKAPITGMSATAAIGLGALEAVAAGISSIPAMAAKGISLLGGASRETADKVEDFLTAKPFTPAGKLIANALSQPFEWWDQENIDQIGDPIRESTSGLLQSELGVRKDTADMLGNIAGTFFETPGRSLPYIAGLRVPSPKALPDTTLRPGDAGHKPPPWEGEAAKAAPEPMAEKIYAEKVIEPEVPPTTTPKPVTKPFEVYEEFTPGVDAWNKTVLAKDGTAVGKLDGLIDKNKQELTFRNQEIGAEHRGQGIGTGAFREVVDYALDNKLTVKSDASVTIDAARLYESASESGKYIIEKNPDAVLETTPGGIQRWVSESADVPVFKIYERTLKGDEVSRPIIDYSKLQDAALAEDLTRTVTTDINKPMPRNPSTFVVDERPLHELKPELYKVTTHKTIEAGTGATELLTREYSPTYKDLPARYGEGGRLIPGRGQYISSTFVGVIKHSPIVKWAISQGRREMLWVQQQFHELMFGTDVVMQFGKPKYQPTERGWGTKFNTLSLEERVKVMDARELLDVPGRTERVSPEALEAYGLSPKAIEFFYFDMDTISKPTLGVNSVIGEMRKVGYNLEPFTMYEGYNPHLWIGDFRTFVKDKAGNVLTVISSDNIVSKKLVESRLKKQFGDRYDININSYTRKDKTNDMSMEAINDLIARVEDKFPEQAGEINAFLQGQKDIKGMGVHGLNRKGATGFLGDGSTILDPVKRSAEFQKSREIFIHGMLRKESSLRLRFSMDQLREDPVLNRLYPNSIKYSDNSINDYLGRKTLADEILSEYTARMFGQSGIKKGVEVSSAIMTYPILLMGSVPNIAVQPFQVGYGVIKSIGMRNSLGLTSAQVHTAWAQGMLDMFTRTPENLDVALTAGKRGAVSPEFIQMMHESEALQGKPLQHSSWYKDLATGKLLYSTPDEYSRLTQVYGFYRTLRMGGKSHEIAKLDAIELSKQYSVPYNNLERPAAYRGTAGAVIGKFQTWSSNQYAQLLEHVDTAKLGDSTPLASYIAYSALVSGLYGFWGIQEADWLVEQVNKKFQTTHPTPSMHISEFAPDWLAYGPIQASTGYTTGTTTLPAFNRRLTSVAMIDFYSELVASTTNLASKAMGMGSPPTPMDVERAMIAWAPRSMHSVIKTGIERGEIGSIPEGESVLLHDPKTGKGTSRQDRHTQIINDLGGKTIAQHKMSLINRWVQGVEESRKLTIKDWATYVAISASMDMPVNLDKFADRIAEEYMISPKEFMSAVSTAAEKFNKSTKERVFDVQSTKGRRAGAKFYDDLEQDKPKDFFINDK